MLGEEVLQLGGFRSEIRHCICAQLDAGESQRGNVFDRLPVVSAPRNRGVAKANRSWTCVDRLIKVRKIRGRIQRSGSRTRLLSRRAQIGGARYPKD